MSLVLDMFSLRFLDERMNISKNRAIFFSFRTYYTLRPALKGLHTFSFNSHKCMSVGAMISPMGKVSKLRLTEVTALLALPNVTVSR